MQISQGSITNRESAPSEFQNISQAEIPYKKKELQQKIQRIQKERNYNQVWIYVDIQSFYVNCHLLLEENKDKRDKPCVVVRPDSIEKWKQFPLCQNKEATQIKTSSDKFERLKQLKNQKVVIFPHNQQIYRPILLKLFQIAFKYDNNFIRKQGSSFDSVNIKLNAKTIKNFKNRTCIRNTVEQIKKEIQNEIKIPTKIGVGPTSYLSKTLLKKPINQNDTIQILMNDQKQIAQYLDKLTLQNISGDKQIIQLANKQIFSIKDLLEHGYRIKKQDKQKKLLCKALGFEPPQGKMEITFNSYYHKMFDRQSIIQSGKCLIKYFFSNLRNHYLQPQNQKVNFEIQFKNKHQKLNFEPKFFIKGDQNNILTKFEQKLTQLPNIIQAKSIKILCKCNDSKHTNPPITHSAQSFENEVIRTQTQPQSIVLQPISLTDKQNKQTKQTKTIYEINVIQQEKQQPKSLPKEEEEKQE